MLNTQTLNVEMNNLFAGGWQTITVTGANAISNIKLPFPRRLVASTIIPFIQPFAGIPDAPLSDAQYYVELRNLTPILPSVSTELTVFGAGSLKKNDRLLLPVNITTSFAGILVEEFIIVVGVYLPQISVVSPMQYDYTVHINLTFES